MASFKLVLKPSAEKELRDVPLLDRRRLVAKIAGLAEQPTPVGSEKLEGDVFYRMRQGDWRVIYEIDRPAKVVRIMIIGHRREVYRRRR